MGIDYTGGWNAVIVTDFARVNRLLAYAYDQKITPHQGEIEFDVHIGPVVIPAKANAQIGPWQMVGGSGQNVVLRIPFTGGKAAIGNTVCSLEGVWVRVQVLLRFVSSTVSGGGTRYQLMLNFTDSSAFVSLNFENPPSNLTAQDLEALAITLRNLLQANAAKQGITIANLNLSSIAANYPWLMPNHGISYAAGSDSASGGQLAILIASIDPPPRTPTTLQSGVIPAGCDAALILSNMIFSKYFLAPPFASSLNVPVTRMSYSGLNPTSVVLNGETGVGGGTITTATAVANNDKITIHLKGHGSPMSGVDVDFTVDAEYGLVLGGSAANPTITFQRVSENESHSTDIAWWVWLISGLSGGAVGIAVAALIGQIVNNLAGSSLRGTMPASFATAIAWPFSGTVVITKALLPTPLQLGGQVQ